MSSPSLDPATVLKKVHPYLVSPGHGNVKQAMVVCREWSTSQGQGSQLSYTPQTTIHNVACNLHGVFPARNTSHLSFTLSSPALHPKTKSQGELISCSLPFPPPSLSLPCLPLPSRVLTVPVDISIFIERKTILKRECHRNI